MEVGEGRVLGLRQEGCIAASGVDEAPACCVRACMTRRQSCMLAST
jgi:hypothetical protein